MQNKSIAQTIIPLYKEMIPNAKSVIDEEISELGSDHILGISKISKRRLLINKKCVLR